jgi:hypothetical protein
MFLDGDMKALMAYRSGDRSAEKVKLYFCRHGIPPPAAAPAQSAESAKPAGAAG